MLVAVSEDSARIEKGFYTMAERALRKHIQIEKAPAN